MSKVKYESLNSANVKISNSSDTSKAYDIEANANIAASGKEITSFDGGTVHKDGTMKASFNLWNPDNMSISYNGVPASEQCNVLNAINAYVEDARTFVSQNPVVANE